MPCNEINLLREITPVQTERLKATANVVLFCMILFVLN